jgi:hypothetical protein
MSRRFIATVVSAVLITAAGTVPGVAAQKTLGERLAAALPPPITGWIAKERIEDNTKTKQVRVQRVYFKNETDDKASISILLRTETPATLKKRRETFLNEKVVKAKKGEFRTINGQRFSILRIKGEYTAMTVVDNRYTVLFFGTKDKSILYAYIITTDFKRLATIRK